MTIGPLCAHGGDVKNINESDRMCAQWVCKFCGNRVVAPDLELDAKVGSHVRLAVRSAKNAPQDAAWSVGWWDTSEMPPLFVARIKFDAEDIEALRAAHESDVL